MLDNYTKEVNLLVTWYERAKEVAIVAESMDSRNNAYIQPLHEQRYCLDHFVRAIAYENKSENDENIKKSIISAVGHLQRTYSDCVEWILVNVKEEYITTLNQYSNEQINAVFPEYYTEIRPAFDKITDVINNYKINKSVEKATQLSDNELEMLNNVTEQFVSSEIVKKLDEYLKVLHQRESSLIEHRARERRVAIRDKIIWPILTGIAGGLIVALIMR